MNLPHNIRTLRQAIEDDHIPLKQSLKILDGVQKVYQRLLMYLYDDSKVVLHQMEEPFRAATGADADMKDEQESESPNKTKQKRKKESAAGAEPGVRGYQGGSGGMKLNLNNLKWW